MKLGSETGSVMNHLYSRMTIGAPAPELGLGVTILHWTDRSPGTIVRMYSTTKGLVIGVADDEYHVISGSEGLSEDVDYEFIPSEPGSTPRYHFRAAPGGGWESVAPGKRTGTWKKSSGPGILVGRRERYYDPSF